MAHYFTKKENENEKGLFKLKAKWNFIISFSNILFFWNYFNLSVSNFMQSQSIFLFYFLTNTFFYFSKRKGLPFFMVNTIWTKVWYHVYICKAWSLATVGLVGATWILEKNIHIYVCVCIYTLRFSCEPTMRTAPYGLTNLAHFSIEFFDEIYFLISFSLVVLSPHLSRFKRTPLCWTVKRIKLLELALLGFVLIGSSFKIRLWNKWNKLKLIVKLNILMSSCLIISEVL